ncbi:hypothetical protein HD553DRAFT_347294 [Filobasidium floriforme]|uniref:uncharacterized protein n=1 Tax=Filobasidium floriforme TaxID=5210 RepID=UPI001E8EE1BA|nr:uncharacterized protein HD553DRAFT_347294 [Filobasidium floriforme]KAH8090833.1 hypothetical protein HD553DRAFT_347294 [Filobasidium floriforme]
MAPTLVSPSTGSVESVRLIIVIQIPKDFPGDFLPILTKYLQKIRDDTVCFMGSARLRPFATDTILVDSDSRIPKEVVEDHLQKHLNMDIGLITQDHRDVPGFIKGVLQYSDKRAPTGPGPSVLVTVHPSDRASHGKVLPPQVPDMLIGLQGCFKVHYALCIENYFRRYFRDRLRAGPSFYRVEESVSHMDCDESNSVTIQSSGISHLAPEIQISQTVGYTVSQNESVSQIRADQHQSDQILIAEFTGVEDLRNKLGGTPCLRYHMMDGKCEIARCDYLHQQIKFTPEAVEDYRTHLRETPCRLGEKCNFLSSGTCWSKHRCPAGTACINSECRYVHQGEYAYRRIPLPPDDRDASWDDASYSTQLRSLLYQAWDLKTPMKPSGCNVIDIIVDFVPLVRVLWDVSGLKAESKLPRGLIGAQVDKHWYPLGAKRYADFKTYTHVAAQRGYVTLGLDISGNAWIQSTGKLETMCGIDPDQ